MPADNFSLMRIKNESVRFWGNDFEAGFFSQKYNGKSQNEYESCAIPPIVSAGVYDCT
jgi:hypothetical protein